MSFIERTDYETTTGGGGKTLIAILLPVLCFCSFSTAYATYTTESSRHNYATILLWGAREKSVGKMLEYGTGYYFDTETGTFSLTGATTRLCYIKDWVPVGPSWLLNKYLLSADRQSVRCVEFTEGMLYTDGDWRAHSSGSLISAKKLPEYKYTVEFYKKD